MLYNFGCLIGRDRSKQNLQSTKSESRERTFDGGIRTFGQ